MKYKSARLAKIKAQRRKRGLIKLAIIGILSMLMYQVVATNYTVTIQSPIKIERKEFKLISPIPDEVATPSATPKSATPGASIKIVREVLAKEPEPTPEPEIKKDLNYLEGEASYYSREGCIGCSENLTMANGQELDDTALTLALTPEVVNSGKRLNDYVTVENIKTGQTVKARVTDTGGFGKYNRVADLSVATKDAIGCSSLCQVKVIFD